MASTVGHTLAGIVIYCILDCSFSHCEEAEGRQSNLKEIHHLSRNDTLSQGARSVPSFLMRLACNDRIKRILPFLILPNLPDFDLLISFILYNNINTIHSEFTHTLLFAFIVAIFLMPLHIFGSPLRTFLTGLLLICSHIFLDMIAGDPFKRKGMGVPLLYPFFEARISSPIILLFGPHHQTFKDLFSIYNFIGVIWELLLFIPIIVSIRLFRLRG